MKRTTRIGCLALLHILHYTLCKEIVATDEWTLVQEGDTIPAGLHVRMDIFATGQKWVKLLDEEDGDTNTKDSSSHSSLTRLHIQEDTQQQQQQETNANPIRITQLTDDSTLSMNTAEMSNRILSNFQKQQQRTTHKNKVESISKLNDFSNDVHKDEADYMTMYRTLLSLPLEEQERMGGLPSLPPSLSTLLESNHTDLIVDDKDLKQVEEEGKFIQNIRTIWTQRQEELKQIQQEMLVDTPTWIQDQISVIQQFVQNPLIHLLELYHASTMQTESLVSSNNNIVSTLHELEFQVCDLDMARDFHTLGGWPLLASLLLMEPDLLENDFIHGTHSTDTRRRIQDSMYDNTTDGMIPTAENHHHYSTLTPTQAIQSLTWEIQGLASWVIGSSVKNVEEFHSWACEDLSSHFMVLHSTTDSKLSSLKQQQQQQGHVNITMINVLLSNLATSPALDIHSKQASRVLEPNSSLEHWLLSFIRKRQKEFYALGSILRGNDKAVERFMLLDGPSTLLYAMEGISDLDIYHSTNLKKNIASVKSKASNLVMDLMQSHNLNDPRLLSWIIPQSDSES